MFRRINILNRSRQRPSTSRQEPTTSENPPRYSDIDPLPDFLDVSGDQTGDSNLNDDTPGLVIQPLQTQQISKVNLTICTKIILSNLTKSLSEKTCLQLLYTIQQHFVGNRFILPVILYSVGKSLCHLESYGQGSFIGKNNSTLNYSIETNASINWFANSNLDFEFLSPGFNFKVALSYELSPSMFKGHEFPGCVPKWMRPVFRASKSYKIIYDDLKGFYVV